MLDALIDGHIDFALDDRPLITLHDRELDRLREADRKRVRQLQRQYVELWVEVVRRVHPVPSESEARAAVHAVFGLLNSTPHLGRPGALPGRTEMAELLHRLALGAFGAVAGESVAAGVPGCSAYGAGRGAYGRSVASPTGPVRLWTALVTGG